MAPLSGGERTSTMPPSRNRNTTAPKVAPITGRMKPRARIVFVPASGRTVRLPLVMRFMTLTTAPAAPPRTLTVAVSSSSGVKRPIASVPATASARNMTMPTRYSSCACRCADDS